MILFEYIYPFNYYCEHSQKEPFHVPAFEQLPPAVRSGSRGVVLKKEKKMFASDLTAMKKKKNIWSSQDQENLLSARPLSRSGWAIKIFPDYGIKDWNCRKDALSMQHWRLWKKIIFCLIVWYAQRPTRGEERLSSRVTHPSRVPRVCFALPFTPL